MSRKINQQKVFLCILFFSSIFSVSIFPQNTASIQNKNLTEKEKTDSLITIIETLKGAQFLRNGTYYDAKAAAAHLRMKLKKGGKYIKTANDFIGKIASKSSTTGTPYKIKFKDGREIETGKFLFQKLAEMEK